MKTFKDLGLSKEILEKIEKKGYKEPSQIQDAVIPLLLKGTKDIIAQAQTGSGKTAAFSLPILEKIDLNRNETQALILAPTRELAIQIANEIKSFADNKLKIQLIYGGQSIQKELEGLRKNPHIVVGTTGRVLDHLINKKSLKVGKLSFLVLDEADEMLNMGFIDDIEEILKYTPNNKQTLLFSATMPKAIKALAVKYLKNYDEVKIEKKELTNPNIEQKYYLVDNRNKFDALCRILEIEPDFYGIVFCKTKSDVDEVSSKLLQKGYKAEGLHGDISQNLREKTLGRFKNQAIKVLIATDVAARGIDINNLTHVINYKLPDNPETYTHRIGRTGRAGNKGEAISLVSRQELRNLNWIEKTTKSKIKKEELPNVEDLIKAKKERLINQTKYLLENQQKRKYLELSKELLKLGNPEEVLSAILEEAFGNEYLITHYKNIKSNENSNNETRLFIAKGKQDGMKTPASLIKFLEMESGYKLGQVGRIDLKDKFSFISLSDEDAFVLIKHFKKVNPRRPLVSQAKERK